MGVTRGPGISLEGAARTLSYVKDLIERGIQDIQSGNWSRNLVLSDLDHASRNITKLQVKMRARYRHERAAT